MLFRSDIVSCIVQSAIEFSPRLKDRRNSIGVADPRQAIKSEVAGYPFLPDWRTVRRRPSEITESSTQNTRHSNRPAKKRQPNDEYERSRASKEAADITTIGEFKVNDRDEDKHDVCHSSFTLILPAGPFSRTKSS